MKISIVFLIFILLLACVQRDEESTDSNIIVEYPDQESWNTKMTLSKDGKKVGVVHANHLKKYSKRGLTFIEDGLKVDFYDDYGNHSSVLNSEGGKVEDAKQDMIAYGNVVVLSDSGMTLYTDTLKWDNERQKIISEIPVKITSERDTLFGDSFISDPNLENYEITNSHGTGSELLRKKP